MFKCSTLKRKSDVYLTGNVYITQACLAYVPDAEKAISKSKVVVYALLVRAE